MNRRPRGERGTAIVELVLIVPVLLGLAIGLAEFGLGWRDSLTVSNAMRAGARVGSSAANARTADYEVLQAVRAAVADLPTGAVERIVVYDAAGVNGDVPTACAAGTPGPTCNVYTEADLLLPVSAFGGTASSCAADAVDRYWCPTGRKARQSGVGGPPDYLGVWIQVRHAFVTGLFGSGLTITDGAVMRVEPQL